MALVLFLFPCQQLLCFASPPICPPSFLAPLIVSQRDFFGASTSEKKRRKSGAEGKGEEEEERGSHRVSGSGMNPRPEYGMRHCLLSPPLSLFSLTAGDALSPVVSPPVLFAGETSVVYTCSQRDLAVGLGFVSTISCVLLEMRF